MKSTQPFEQDDLALYAMQLLPADQAATIAEQLENSPELRKELAEIQGDLAIYAHTVDLHSPPALARERLMKQVAREKKIVPVTQAPVREFPVRPSTQLGIDSSYMRQVYAEEHVEEPRSFGSKVLPWAGWAIAAGMAVTAGNFYRERNLLQSTVASNAGQLTRLTADAAAARQLLDTLNDTTALRVTLQKPLTAPFPQARATYVAQKGSLIFLANNMEPLLPYKVYELWIIPADGRDPIPAGTFHPDARGNASVIMPNLPKGVEAKAFGVTIEDEGGATTPTLPIIMAGA